MAEDVAEDRMDITPYKFKFNQYNNRHVISQSYKFKQLYNFQKINLTIKQLSWKVGMSKMGGCVSYIWIR